MFTNIIITWLLIALMIGMIGIVYAKLVSKIHPFRFLEHKATTIGLLFISGVTIITLVESILMYVRISHRGETGNFTFALMAFVSFSCAIWTTFPDIYSERISLSMYRLFFGIAAFFEIFGTIIFYLSWIYL